MSDSLSHQEFQSLLRQAVGELPPDIDLEFRKMFGGTAAYVRGRVFAIRSTPGLALKLEETDQKALLHEPGAAYLQHDPDRPVSKQYIVVPPHIRENQKMLKEWVKRSVDYAKTLPLPKKRRRM
ncbi:MAG: TfoX/Sxy family protein [Anaerolineae bacterium]|nr:TfoX/Sxy family protein [Anaerolineae bacterium]